MIFINNIYWDQLHPLLTGIRNWLRTMLFWTITQRIVVISYLCFETPRSRNIVQETILCRQHLDSTTFWKENYLGGNEHTWTQTNSINQDKPLIFQVFIHHFCNSVFSVSHCTVLTDVKIWDISPGEVWKLMFIA